MLHVAQGVACIGCTFVTCHIRGLCVILVQIKSVAVVGGDKILSMVGTAKRGNTERGLLLWLK